MLRLYKIISENPKKYVLRPLIFYWGLIFILTTLPGNVIVNSIKLSDKIEHILAYFGLAFLLSFAIKFFREHYFILKRIFVTLAVSVLYGGFDEFHQLFIPKRQADLLDLMADALGALIGLLVAELLIYLADRALLKKQKEVK